MPESGESVFDVDCPDCDEKDEEISKLEDLLENKDDELQEAREALSEAKDELYSIEERENKEIQDLQSDIDERKYEMKEKDSRIQDLESIAYDLDKIAYSAVVALHIVNRFLPAAQRDLVNMRMLLEQKKTFDFVVGSTYELLVDIAYSSKSTYPLPQFEEKEEV